MYKGADGEKWSIKTPCFHGSWLYILYAEGNKVSEIDSWHRKEKRKQPHKILKKQSQCDLQIRKEREREIDFEELAQAILKAVKSHLQARYPGKVVV